MSIFLPSPLWERVAPNEVRRGEGFLRLGELCENVLQDGSRLLQNVIVPVARDSKAFCDQDGISRCVAFRRCVLTAIDFVDQAFLEANEIKNKV
jgi:hypothetical protein